MCAVTLLLPACGRGATTAAPAPAPGWQQVGSWSGHGDLQTESFTSDSGGVETSARLAGMSDILFGGGTL